MANLPPIEMGQLKLLLSDPKMPEHRILKQVADTIDSKSEKSDASESEAEDQGCPNIFDMFIEAALKTDQQDEVEEDDDEADHVPYHVQLQCRFCAKSYDSSWRLNMHVAVKHASEAELLEKAVRPRPAKRLKSRSGDDARAKKQRLSPRQEEVLVKEKDASQDSHDVVENFNTGDSLLDKIIASAEKEEEAALQKELDSSSAKAEPKDAVDSSHSSPSPQNESSKASDKSDSSHTSSTEKDQTQDKQNLSAGNPDSSSV